jgi:hypothetical protein
MGKAVRSANLPPRHSGYRAATSGRFVTKATKGRVLPKPPAGEGGGSKSAKTSRG